ncbi:hypothetical protein D9757_013084 [Collybiopsis confluens]|uniref:Uncharacterized protein n=1 Tax=Collybiopsis confluens TaxID=2823264 RepID=A0A8H5GH96_9AGAR|nr:hypothetical protein D9757_013084 [Collybiopsis confluens]
MPSLFKRSSICDVFLGWIHGMGGFAWCRTWMVVKLGGRGTFPFFHCRQHRRRGTPCHILPGSTKSTGVIFFFTVKTPLTYAERYTALTLIGLVHTGDI